VLQVVEEEYRQYVSPGDIVLEVDDRPVRRGDAVFFPPIKPSYTFSILRGEEIVTQEVVIAAENPVTQVWKLSLTVLALAFWSIGFLIVFFSRQDHPPPLYAGLSFQLIAAGIISPGPSQMGAPGGWIVGQVLIFSFPLIMLYLSFLPRYSPLPPAVSKLLLWSGSFLAILATLAAIEVLFLYPNSSFQTLTGVSTANVLTVLTGLSIVAALAILLTRLRRAVKGSYERQQLTILSFFLAMAVLPLFALVVLPVGRYIFVPYPFVFSLFLLAPAGYFFVLHRHGYLVLDSVFSRIAAVVMLVLAVMMAYATGAFLWQEIFQVELGDIEQGGFLLVLLGIAIAGQRHVQTLIDLLLYGRDQLSRDSVRTLTSSISANPEPATVAEVAAQISDRLRVKHVVVLVKGGHQFSLLAASEEEGMLTQVDDERLHTLQLRAGSSEGLANTPEWVELSIPIAVRGEILGLFWLSRPVNGYFNARQIAVLRDVADILAFGLQVISLVEVTQTLSRQMLYEKELQRQKLATEIHNEPLQTLAVVIRQLRDDASNETIHEAAQAIRQVTKDLRRIITGLRPPALTKSLEWMVRHVVRDFEERHATLDVQLEYRIETENRLPEPGQCAVYYVLTEALNNVSRHAQATLVQVRLDCTEQALTLAICDDGVGGMDDSQQSYFELLRRGHFGLADMHRWALTGGGELQVGPNFPNGTVIRLSLPGPVG